MWFQQAFAKWVLNSQKQFTYVNTISLTSADSKKMLALNPELKSYSKKNYYFRDNWTFPIASFTCQSNLNTPKSIIKARMMPMEANSVLVSSPANFELTPEIPMKAGVGISTYQFNSNGVSIIDNIVKTTQKVHSNIYGLSNFLATSSNLSTAFASNIPGTKFLPAWMNVYTEDVDNQEAVASDGGAVDDLALIEALVRGFSRIFSLINDGSIAIHFNPEDNVYPLGLKLAFLNERYSI